MTDAEEYLMMCSQIVAYRKALREVAHGGFNPFHLRNRAMAGIFEGQCIEYNWRMNSAAPHPNPTAKLGMCSAGGEPHEKDHYGRCENWHAITALRAAYEKHFACLGGVYCDTDNKCHSVLCPRNKGAGEFKLFKLGWDAALNVTPLPREEPTK